jgi:hypothetical protein
LPELDERPGRRAEPDVRVVLEATIAGVPADGGQLVESDRCAFRVPEAGSYEVRGGRTIAVQPASDAQPEVVRTFVLGSAWGALLQQRGELPLHGAVVADGHGAIAFCGPQTAGKSSTAAWLARRGFRLVSDDLSRVEVPAADEPPRVWPSHRLLKLSHEALRVYGRGVDGLAREPSPEGPRAGKYLLPWPERAPGPISLRSVCLLDWGDLEVRRLTGISALRAFVAAATYRPRFVSEPAELAGHWRLCTEIARRVPVWQLTRPRDWAVMEDVVESVLAGPVPNR